MGRRQGVESKIVNDRQSISACFELMRQLRPHLRSESEFEERVSRQQRDGYQLVALWEGPRPLALAGYRVQDNLMHGRHLYVDDLVTNEAVRGHGLGEQLMNWLKREGRVLGCAKLVLDTPISNTAGHRFYRRQALDATALRFAISLDVHE